MQAGHSFNSACGPTGSHTSDGQHSIQYCSGWAQGYTTTKMAGNITQNAPTTQPSDAYQTGHNAGVTAAQNFNRNLKSGTIAPSDVLAQQTAIYNQACSSGASNDYCGGFENGFNATVNYLLPPNLNANSKSTSTPQVSNSNQPFVGQDFGDLNNIPLVGGFIASKSVSTGILHNENGIFIPWSKICASGQQYLQQDCSQLVDQSTGVLTA